jgi:hypothetical protein
MHGAATEKSHTGRDGDNGVGDLLAKICLSSLLHFRKDHGTDFFGSLVAQSILASEGHMTI